MESKSQLCMHLESGCIRFHIHHTICCSSHEAGFPLYFNIQIQVRNLNRSSAWTGMYEVPAHHNIIFCSSDHSSVWIFIMGSYTHLFHIIPFHAKSMHGTSVFGHSKFSGASIVWCDVVVIQLCMRELHIWLWLNYSRLGHSILATALES